MHHSRGDIERINMLGCTNYVIERPVGAPVKITVDFILKINPRNTDEINAALFEIERMLSGGDVEIIRSNEKSSDTKRLTHE